MYTIKENKKPKENKNTTKKIVIFSILSVVIVILLIVLLILLLRFKQKPNENNKTKYEVIYTPNEILKDTSSLDENNNFLLSLTTTDNKYQVETNLNSSNNVSIGSYQTFDYLYKVYDGHPNKLNLTVNIKDINTNTYLSLASISDISFLITYGDIDSHTEIETIDNINNNQYQLNKEEEISIYQLKVRYTIITSL